MFRSKLGLLGLCVMVLGVMAISASGAQAAGSWLVGTTEITNTSSLVATVAGEIDTPEPKLLSHLVGLTLTLTCTNFTTSGISLKAEGKLAEGGKVVFTGCTVEVKDKEGTKSASCTVKSSGSATGTIDTEELKGELVLHTFFDIIAVKEVEFKIELKEVLTKIEPKGEALATIRFEGVECLLPLSNKLTGTLFVTDPFGLEAFAVEHLIKQASLTSISLGADTAEHLETSLDGSAWLKLTGEHFNKEWRAMGV